MKFANLARLVLVLAAFVSLHAEAETFQYANPIDSPPIRDPQITRVGDLWYMVATSPPFFPPDGSMENPGDRIWSSHDLKTWTLVTTAVAPSATHWYKQRFWAPELFPYEGKWYLTFNCPDGAGSAQRVGLAVADTIRGPYTVVTKDAPLSPGNDATLFQDDDGKVYLFHSGDHFGAGLFVVEVDLKHGKTVGPQAHILSPAPASEAAWDGPTKTDPDVDIEAPSVLKRGNTYYLLYASWGRGYEEGYATATRITGPWHKFKGNPVFGAQDLQRCRALHRVCTQPADVPFTQAAHGSPFIGPDGELWFGCHGILRGPGQQPHLVIARMKFSQNGEIQMKLTWRPQAVTVPDSLSLHLHGFRMASPELPSLAIRGHMSAGK